MTTNKDHISFRFSDLEDLEDKVRKARSASKWGRKDVPDKPPPSALGIAFRVATELVVSVMFGVGVGWGLDRWLGTAPWFLLVFFFLGVGAGFLNVYRITMPARNAPRGDDENDNG